MILMATIGTALEMYKLCLRIQPLYKQAFLVFNIGLTIYILYILLYHVFPEIFHNEALSLIPVWSAIAYIGLMFTLKSRNTVRFGLPVINVIYPFIGWMAVIELAFMGGEYSWTPLVILLLCVWSSDAAAYLVGSTLKGPKLAVGISPNKTISGWVGALIGVALATILTSLFWTEWSWITVVLWIPSIWLSATLGDLFESLIKRLAVIKDSGFFLPGHGGFLDRLDSLLFAAPFAYFILYIFEL